MESVEASSTTEKGRQLPCPAQTTSSAGNASARQQNSDSALGCFGLVSSPRIYEFDEKYFVSLYPKQSFELFKHSDDLVSEYSCLYQNPGNYKMRLKLDHSKDTLSYWTTKHDYDSTMLKMFNLIPKEIFTSNEITFTIK